MKAGRRQYPIRWLRSAQRMRLRDGDVVVVNVNRSVSQSMADSIREHVSLAFPNRQCLVLGEGMQIGAIGEGRAQ